MQPSPEWADATFGVMYFGLNNATDVNDDGYDDFWIGETDIYLFHGAP